jgi:acyl carrier protein
MTPRNDRLIQVFRSLFPSLSASTDTDIEAVRAEDVPDWDSIGQLNLLVAIEEEFDLSVPDEVALELDSFAAVDAFVAGSDGAQ